MSKTKLRQVIRSLGGKPAVTTVYAPVAPPLGAALREARLAANLSRRELAEKAGVPEITIRQWETGKRQPNPDGYAKAMTATGADCWQELAALAKTMRCQNAKNLMEIERIAIDSLESKRNVDITST